jgi:hypothetical protein
MVVALGLALVLSGAAIGMLIGHVLTQAGS